MKYKLVCVALFVMIATPGPSAEARASYKGFAARYSKGVMERVSRVRHLPVVRCMVASPYHKIGTWVTVTGLRTGRARSCRVTDVPQPFDRATIIRRGIVAELDHRSALAICGSVVDPPRQCPVKVR